MPRNLHPARKKFTRFASKKPFQFGLPNVNPALGQSSDGSPIYLTRANSLLRQQALATAPGVKIKSDIFRPLVLPRAQWSETDFAQNSVLFLIPDDALGDCVGMVLFLRAFRQRYPAARIGVLNSAGASDLFATIDQIAIFQLFISSKHLANFDTVIDLSEMEGWETIDRMPVNPEEALCTAFDLTPVTLPERAPVLKPAMNIAILPMASSPLRSLPPALVNQIAALLGKAGHKVTISLNAYQGVMRKYKNSLDLGAQGNIAAIDGFKTIGELTAFIADQDYVVLADSGPAHITKLFQTPGLAIYTSASGQVLQGRHRNLRSWQSRYEGEFCCAPCGLAKLRASADGKIGCMGSLELPIDALGDVPTQSNKAIAERLTIDAPVPCVAELLRDQKDILDVLRDDLKIA